MNTNIDNAHLVTKRAPDSKGRVYGTGRRKESVARVWLKKGSGQFVVNHKTMDEYFHEGLRYVINDPFKKLDLVGQFDIWCTVSGGGTSGQAGAVRHGASKALLEYDETLRSQLRSHGFLTRDSREVERKKYGKKKARKSQQFSKR
jgi:small subunit ribosomal protein S9